MKNLEDKEKEKTFKINIIKNILMAIVFIFAILYDATFSDLRYPILSSIVFFIFILYSFIKKYLR